MLDEPEYFKFTGPNRIDKTLNTLLGILDGISADNKVSKQEFQLLAEWVEANRSLIQRHPYNEIVPVIESALKDGNINEDELLDLAYICKNVLSTVYYQQNTASLQVLQGLMAAIAADGFISDAEITHLREWMDEHESLRTCWPYDEIDSLLTAILVDHRIDPSEQSMLLHYLESFSSPGTSLAISNSTTRTLPGICAVMPRIVFDAHHFCFTGESSHCSRKEMTDMVTDRQGIVLSSPSPKLDYLIVGANGNPCWAFACYGRKIEHVMTLRQQQKANTLIVHENDFFDAI